MRKRIYELVANFIREHGVAPTEVHMSHDAFEALVRECHPLLICPDYFKPYADPSYDGMKIKRSRDARLAVALVMEE